MTGREKIIKILELKQARIKELTGLDYITPEDLEEIKKINTKQIKKIMNRIKENYNDLDDSDICPWCSVSFDECGRCSYGTRHGFCDQENSKYRKIIDKLGHKIYSIPGLVEAIKEIYNKPLVEYLVEYLKIISRIRQILN